MAAAAVDPLVYRPSGVDDGEQEGDQQYPDRSGLCATLVHGGHLLVRLHRPASEAVRARRAFRASMPLNIASAMRTTSRTVTPGVRAEGLGERAEAARVGCREVLDGGPEAGVHQGADACAAEEDERVPLPGRDADERRSRTPAAHHEPDPEDEAGDDLRREERVHLVDGRRIEEAEHDEDAHAEERGDDRREHHLQHGEVAEVEDRRQLARGSEARSLEPEAEGHPDEPRQQERCCGIEPAVGEEGRECH